jgi:hypothetical protein
MSRIVIVILIYSLHKPVDSINLLGFTNKPIELIIGFCILLRVILIVNNNTFCFATIDKVFT